MHLFRGVPTGQPIACVLFNIYLHDLDRRLDAVPGGFYARFSDDILFAHPEPGPVGEAAQIIARTCAELELALNAEKSRDLYVTVPGRPAPPGVRARARSAIPFLGVEVGADGTARALRGATPEAVGRAVCAVLNRALNPEDAPFRQRSADILWRSVTSRAQLRHFDDLITRMVLREVSGRIGVRPFRDFPARTIREDWGLFSLYHGRNRRPRERA
jgi:hypothetical protein